MKKLFFVGMCLLFGQIGFTQLQKPILTSSNVDWGWFNLQINTFSVVPKATQWLIREKATGKVVLDTKCDQKTNANCQVWCKNDFYGDSRDVRDKLVQGCKPNTSYWVKARNTDKNGTAWAPWSDSVEVQTPPMPALSGDEIIVNVFGDFFVRYGDQCNLISTIRLGDEEQNIEDNFCHATQNEIRRLSGKNIRIVNQGEINGLQSEFLSKHGNRFIQEFSDTKKYPLAVFCFGANDAKNAVSPTKYASDIDTLVGYLTSLKIKSLINSIHYISDTTYISADLNTRFRNSWSAKMSEISTSGTTKADYMTRGLDFHQLFRINETRQLGPDGVHIDLTEGVSNIASKLAPAILDILFPGWVNTNNIESKRLLQVYINQGEIMLNTEGLSSGKYVFQMQSLTGTLLQQNELVLHEGDVINSIELNSQLSDGVYLVQLLHKSSGALYSNKVFISR